MVRPGVELQPGVRLRHELGELAGRVRRAKAVRLVAAAGGRLADRDLGLRVPRLESGIPGCSQLCVVRRRYRAAARVELRAEEELEVRLVPDRPEAHERISHEPARVARRDRAREAGEVGDPRGHDVRVLAAVCPARRAGDRQDHFLIVLLRRPDGLVDVVELVGRIERVRRVGRTRLRREVPLDEKADDRCVVLSRSRDEFLTIGDPAEARIVMEPDPHPLRRQRGWRGDPCEDGQNDDEADDTSHEWSPKKAAGRGASEAPGTLAAPV